MRVDFCSNSRILLILIMALMTAGVARAEAPILVQSTTSTQNSGLYDYLLPLYREATGNRVRIVAVGTGQAIKNARNCDGDVLIVHSKIDEEAFVAEGYGIARHDLIYNDFVLIGPKDDPAGVRGSSKITTALKAVATAETKFVSRGDDSGTHKAERRFWAMTELNADASSGRPAAVPALLGASLAQTPYLSWALRHYHTCL